MTDTMGVLSDIIFRAARRIGATIEDASPNWTGYKFNAELMIQSEAVSRLDRADKDLPRVVSAARFNRIPVLLGALDATASTRRGMHDTLRRYRNQAAITRSWLGDEAPNLQLFLIGSVGSASDSNWRQLAAEAEADDRICRKLVWLPQREPTVEDAELFLGRTFLAKPWVNASTPGAQSPRLDSLGTIELPRGWADVIEDGRLDAETLVEELIKFQEDEPT
jgi:hypothetical protein